MRLGSGVLSIKDFMFANNKSHSLVPRPTSQFLLLPVQFFSTVQKQSCRVEPGNEAINLIMYVKFSF